MSNRPGRFTVDEALALIMEEDDNDFFGELAGAGARDLESDSDGGESDGAGRIQPFLASADDDDSDLDEAHFLDQIIDVTAAARQFTEFEDHLTSSESEEGGEDSARDTVHRISSEG